MANDNDPRDSCYIIILPNSNDDVYVTIPFQIMPAVITDAKSAVFDDANIIGRSSPLKTYKFSSARVLNLTLEFFASLESEDNSEDAAGLYNVKTAVNSLRSLVNPTYTSSTIQRPYKCLVRIGDTLAFIGFCRSVYVSYKGDYPWALNPTRAHYASVALMFEDTGEGVYSGDDIRSGVDFMDITNVDRGLNFKAQLPTATSYTSAG